jgi:hypothetical protein
MTTTSEFHPLAKSLPAMEGDDFDALIAEIKARGQSKPPMAVIGWRSDQ